ncbi:MAG TPA: SRPBCC family protein [Moraxellaceae bacterium]|nr:SRPBCC family protein [Moraxellaceae bacterium]
MGWQQIDIVKDFPYPVEKVFAFLGEHENLGIIFAPASIRRISDGKGARNGVGSAREMRILVGPSFVETVTDYKENELIEYRITRGSPLRDHKGVMRFQSVPGGCRLHYTIEFAGKLPLVAEIVKPVLENGIRKGLAKIRL